MYNAGSRLTVLAAAAVQMAFPLFVNPFRDGGQPIRAQEPSQIEPAGYAFSIWGLIYSAALLYGVWQVFLGRGHPAASRIAPFATVLYAGSSLWLYVAQFGPLWVTMPILVVMAACAFAAAKLAVETADNSWEQTICLVLPFATYAGWTLCATFVNFAEVAPQYGFERLGMSAATFAVLLLTVLTVIVATALRQLKGNVLYGSTVVWALVAIVVRGLNRESELQVLVATGISIAAVLILMVFNRHPA